MSPLRAMANTRAATVVSVAASGPSSEAARVCRATWRFTRSSVAVLLPRRRLTRASQVEALVALARRAAVEIPFVAREARACEEASGGHAAEEGASER